MGQISAKLRRVEDRYAHWCPACESMHSFAITKPNSSGAKWSFDGNVNMPTFTPSMNIKIGPYPTVPEGRPDAGRIDVCHYILTVGVINFCGDCTHSMKGQSVPLPDLPDFLRDA